MPIITSNRIQYYVEPLQSFMCHRVRGRPRLKLVRWNRTEQLFTDKITALGR